MVAQFLAQAPTAVYITGAVIATTVVLFLMTRSKRKTGLVGPQEYVAFKLAERIVVSPDTRIFRFKLQQDTQPLGLPVGMHIQAKAMISGEETLRPYTPITSDDNKGYFDLMIKVYFANVHPKFPTGGKMSQHLDQLKVGESIQFKGPLGRMQYLGRGAYKVKLGQTWTEKRVKRIGMIAGGTGITPMLQIIRAILKDPADTTNVWLLFANQTEQDILLRPELEECAKDARFKLWYTLDRPEPTWKYSAGFISLEMVQQHMPAPEGGAAESIVLMCGPPPMITFACKPNLEKRGFKEDQLHVF